MRDQEKTITKNKRGRPATGLGTLIGVRLQPDMLDWLDAKRAALDPELTRPQMMRRVLEEVMKSEAPIEPPAPKKKLVIKKNPTASAETAPAKSGRVRLRRLVKKPTG